ncbi:hypothetical protein ACIQZG_06560 [Lysinibacillus sp. NPDC096418]|uniref:hypothetical protein n=1 Tax=Lysinibacillus sp. NPDC096418 TaxID=3364138 RepID=UPI0037F69734
MDYLYFPDDKSAYIPAAFEFLVIMILCMAVFFMFKKISKKQELKAQEIEARILGEKNKMHNNQDK